MGIAHGTTKSRAQSILVDGEIRTSAWGVGKKRNSTFFGHDHVDFKGVQQDMFDLVIKHVQNHHGAALKADGNNLWVFVITHEHPQYHQRGYYKQEAWNQCYSIVDRNFKTGGKSGGFRIKDDEGNMLPGVEIYKNVLSEKFVRPRGF